eukprot:scaffold134139_cov19-Tisochrysis_lutea.AAC.2
MQRFDSRCTSTGRHIAASGTLLTETVFPAAAGTKPLGKVPTKRLVLWPFRPSSVQKPFRPQPSVCVGALAFGLQDRNPNGKSLFEAEERELLESLYAIPEVCKADHVMEFMRAITA